MDRCPACAHPRLLYRFRRFDVLSSRGASQGPSAAQDSSIQKLIHGFCAISPESRPASHRPPAAAAPICCGSLDDHRRGRLGARRRSGHPSRVGERRRRQPRHDPRALLRRRRSSQERPGPDEAPTRDRALPSPPGAATISPRDYLDFSDDRTVRGLLLRAGFASESLLPHDPVAFLASQRLITRQGLLERLVARVEPGREHS